MLVISERKKSVKTNASNMFLIKMQIIEAYSQLSMLPKEY